MLKPLRTMNCSSRLLFSLAALCFSSTCLLATQPEVLFEDDFNRGIPGWTAVQPPGNYIDGPMRWQYDIVSQAYLEQSNIYTDAPGGSTNATAVMLINDAETAGNFTYTARLKAGDDDAFGLIFGYNDPQNFYRVTFSRQDRTGEASPAFPYTSWLVDRKVDGVAHRAVVVGLQAQAGAGGKLPFPPCDDVAAAHDVVALDQ